MSPSFFHGCKTKKKKGKRKNNNRRRIHLFKPSLQNLRTLGSAFLCECWREDIVCVFPVVKRRITNGSLHLFKFLTSSS